MIKVFLLTVLLLVNSISVCFADTPKVPEAFLEKAVPWIYVDTNNGVDTYLRIMDYKQMGQSYRVPPEEKGEVDVLYDYKSESKAVLTSFLFDYMKNTYHETTITRPVIKYNGSHSERIGFDNNQNNKVDSIPQGSLIEKIANVSRTYGPTLLAKCLSGTYLTKGTDGSFDSNQPSLRVLKYSDGSLHVIFITGDSMALIGDFNGKTNYCSSHYAVHESRQDGSLQDGASLSLFVAFGESDTNLDNYYSKKPDFDIYRLEIRGGSSDSRLHYEISREKEGSRPNQRDYSGEGTMSCLSR